MRDSFDGIVRDTPPKLAYERYLDAAAHDVATLGELFRTTVSDVRVPTCPDWALYDLAVHLGDFAAFYSHTVCETTGAPRPPWPNTWRARNPQPSDEPPAEYFVSRAAWLVSLLERTAPGARVRTWAPDDQTAHFVARRTAHELAVHRVDGQLSAGRPDPIPSDIAADGVEEIFVMLATRLQAVRDRVGGGTGGGESLCLLPTDADAVWTITLGAEGVQVERARGDAGLDISGAAGDIELLLYQRPPVAPLDQRGDAGVLDAWYRAFTFS